MEDIVEEIVSPADLKVIFMFIWYTIDLDSNSTWGGIVRDQYNTGIERLHSIFTYENGL